MNIFLLLRRVFSVGFQKTVENDVCRRCMFCRTDSSLDFYLENRFRAIDHLGLRVLPGIIIQSDGRCKVNIFNGLWQSALIPPYSVIY